MTRKKENRISRARNHSRRVLRRRAYLAIARCSNAVILAVAGALRRFHSDKAYYAACRAALSVNAAQG